MMTSDNLDDIFATMRTTEPYFEDDGFTSGIMARLPEATQLPTWIANLILLGFTTLGSALAAWQLPLAQWIGALHASTIQIPVFSPVYALGSAALVTFVSSYVVIWLAQNDTI